MSAIVETEQMVRQRGSRSRARVSTVSSDGVPASDPDGTIVRHVWTFGDGASAEGLMVESTPRHARIYPATLTVTDNEGAIGTEKQTVVAEAAPIAAFTFGCSRSRVHLRRLNRATPTAPSSYYEWYFGDGHYGSGPVVTTGSPLVERLRHADRPRQPRGHGQVHEIRGAPNGSAGGVLHLLVQHSGVQLFDGSASSGPNPITAYTWIR